jgi:hypothetical protein
LVNPKKTSASTYLEEWGRLVPIVFLEIPILLILFILSKSFPRDGDRIYRMKFLPMNPGRWMDATPFHEPS